MIKYFLRKELCGNVTNQPETIQDDKETIVYVDIDEKGNSVDFAEVAANAWNNRKLKGSVPANKPRQQEEHTIKNLSRVKRFFVNVARPSLMG